MSTNKMSRQLGAITRWIHHSTLHNIPLLFSVHLQQRLIAPHSLLRLLRTLLTLLDLAILGPFPHPILSSITCRFHTLLGQRLRLLFGQTPRNSIRVSRFDLLAFLLREMRNLDP